MYNKSRWNLVGKLCFRMEKGNSFNLMLISLWTDLLHKQLWPCYNVGYSKPNLIRHLISYWDIRTIFMPCLNPNWAHHCPSVFWSCKTNYLVPGPLDSERHFKTKFDPYFCVIPKLRNSFLNCECKR